MQGANTRKCEVCNGSMVGKRADATVCSDSCRTIKSLRKKTQSIPEVEYSTTALVPYVQPLPVVATIIEPAQMLLNEINTTKALIAQEYDKLVYNRSEIQRAKERKIELIARITALQKEITALKKKVSDAVKTHKNSNYYWQHNSSFLDMLEASKKSNKETPPLEAKIAQYKERIAKISQYIENCKDTVQQAKTNGKMLENRLQSLENHLYRRLKPSDFLPKNTPPKPEIILLPQETANEVSTEIVGREANGRQVQRMKLNPVLELPHDFNKWLGNIEADKCFIALTGIAGAGKTTFSFVLAYLFCAMKLKVKYFSLELGLSNQVRKLVKHYELPTHFCITDTAQANDIEQSAKDFNVVFVDSFSKVYKNASEIDRLRNAHPQTIFVGIFQQTTTGTMRGGSAVNYDASAVWNITKNENGNRICQIHKSRYGKQGTEFIIDNL